MGATAAAATATAATGSFLDFLLGRHAAQLQGHADILADVFLEFFKLLLGIEKSGGHLVLEEGLAGGFEFTDFGGTKLDAGMLLLVEFLAALVDALILQAG